MVIGRVLWCLLMALGVAAVASSGAALAQAEVPPFAGLSDAQPQAEPQTPDATEVGSCAGLHAEVREACEAWLIGAYRHASWSQAYRERAYNAHHYYTMLVFGLVCSLVLLGMYLSYREFVSGEERERTRQSGARKNPARAGSGADASERTGEKDAAAATEVQFGAAGVKVSSRVMGIVILTVSMGFFYLYLATVYPIHENAAANAAGQARAAEANK